MKKWRCNRCNGSVQWQLTSILPVVIFIKYNNPFWNYWSKDSYSECKEIKNRSAMLALNLAKDIIPGWILNSCEKMQWLLRPCTSFAEIPLLCWTASRVPVEFRDTCKLQIGGNYFSWITHVDDWLFIPFSSWDNKCWIYTRLSNQYFGLSGQKLILNSTLCWEAPTLPANNRERFSLKGHLEEHMLPHEKSLVFPDSTGRLGKKYL